MRKSLQRQNENMAAITEHAPQAFSCAASLQADGRLPNSQLVKSTHGATWPIMNSRPQILMAGTHFYGI
jgi:hypothetical protein